MEHDRIITTHLPWISVLNRTALHITSSANRICRSMSTNPPTVEEMKAFVIQALNLEGMTPDMIADEAPLIGKGLGLDSVDALELVVAMEKEFAVRIASNEIDPKAFASVASLTRFIRSRMSGKAGA